MPPPPFLSPLALLVPISAFASPAPGGGGESAVVVIDPADAESMYVANTYIRKRDLPAPNAIYMRTLAPSYALFVAENQAGFHGMLANHRIKDHVDYVVLPPGGGFYVPAPGLISDSCAPVTRFASASAYTLASVSGLVLAGTPSSSPNHYAADLWEARFFDASYPWLQGEPSAGGAQYFIGAMLGYTGPGGNTLAEVLDLVDRSVAADATLPAGTFYYVETTDPARSPPRDFAYPDAVAEMAAVGGVAEHILAVLPLGEHDCLGVMTGWATPDIAGGDFTMLPGSFADHLTSYAGTFDGGGQTKMSEWIRKGTSGTSGAVEEPCNYSGKFPHARLHVLYRQGMTLGSAWLRSMGFLPYQSLLYGDPLTAPWAQPPAVDVPGFDAGPVSGTIVLFPTATATASGASIEALELLVDGVHVQRVAGVAPLTLDTTPLADGWHELRVLAYDTTNVRHTGRWSGELFVENLGLSATLGAPAPGAIDLGTELVLPVAASGGALSELRLVQNGRVVAAGGPATTSLRMHGQNLGAGPVRLQAEAIFAGGARAVSAPLDLDVAYAGGGPGPAPVASSYTKEAQVDVACVVELPASFSDDPAFADYTVLVPPGQASILLSGGGYVLLKPGPGASGLDSLVFEVATPSGRSAPATVVLEYVPPAVFPLPDYFGLDAVVPAQIPALAPGSAKTVALQGTGFGPGTVVAVGGTPLGGIPKPYDFVSPSSIVVDFPQLPGLGRVTVEVSHGALSGSATVEVVPNATPTLQLASGDPGAFVFQFQGVDAILAGTPGSTHVLVGSVFSEPSDLPGVVHLDLGKDFTFAPIVGVHPIDPVKGWTKVHLPLANIPPGTKVYAQSVELTPSLPFHESNRQEMLVVF